MKFFLLNDNLHAPRRIAIGTGANFSAPIPVIPVNYAPLILPRNLPAFHLLMKLCPKRHQSQFRQLKLLQPKRDPDYGDT